MFLYLFLLLLPKNLCRKRKFTVTCHYDQDSSGNQETICDLWPFQSFVVSVFNMVVLEPSAFSLKGPLSFFFHQQSDYKAGGEEYR